MAISSARYYLKNTQTEANTGGTGQGSSWDLSLEQGASPATISGLTNNNANYVLVLSWRKTVNRAIVNTVFPTSYTIQAITNSPSFYPVISRADSSGTIIASSNDGDVQTTTGTFTDSLTLDTDWQNGDQLVFELFGRRDSGHTTPGFTVLVNASSSYVDVEVEDSVWTRLKYYDGTQWLDGKLWRYDGSEWVPAAASRWDGTQWVLEAE